MNKIREYIEREILTRPPTGRFKIKNWEDERWMFGIEKNERGTYVVFETSWGEEWKDERTPFPRYEDERFAVYGWGRPVISEIIMDFKEKKFWFDKFVPSNDAE